MGERTYDKHVAPKVLEACRAAEEHGMPFIAAVQYASGSVGQTRFRPDGSDFAMLLVQMAVEANGNVDLLWMWIERHAKEHGHTSAFLTLRGIPEVPNNAARSAREGE